MDSSTPGFPAFHHLPDLLILMSFESVISSNHLILCHSLLLLPTIPPSIRVFSNELTLRMRWPKYWSFSFSIIPFKEHPGLISFRMDWFDLLAIQGTVKGLLSMQEDIYQTVNGLYHLSLGLVTARGLLFLNVYFRIFVCFNNNPYFISVKYI